MSSQSANRPPSYQRKARGMLSSEENDSVDRARDA